MRHLLAAVTAVVVLGTLAGCTHGREGFIRYDGLKRATFDLDCPMEQLEVTEINGRTVGVAGCDRKTVYKLVFSGKDTAFGEWIRN